ncbi:MAG: hypothetical protein ACLSU0_08995, partial [Oscillospiraceae bacterium]
MPCGNVAAYASINPWRCEQYTTNTPNTGSEIRAHSPVCQPLEMRELFLPHNTPNTGSEKQARQGERGFVRRE